MNTPVLTKQISGDQLQYLIEDYLLTLEDAENEEFCVSAREHARREVSGFVEWLNKRTADEPPAPHDYLRMLARLKWANCRVLDRARPEMVFVNRRVWDEVFLALGPLDDPDAKPENRQAEPPAPLAKDVIGDLERLVAESDGVNDDHSQGYYEGAKKALEIAKGGSLDLGPFLGMEQELRECRRDIDLLNKAGARVREDSEGHRYVELRADKSY